MDFIKSIELDVAGLGFIFYSPFSASGIAEGEDYLESNFEDPEKVEKLALECSIVGVSTGTSGRFLFDIHSGYPPDEILENFEYKLRLGVEVKERTLCIRDLYDLLEWSAKCPNEQKIELDDSFYHLTLLSKKPTSGVLGDDQNILLFVKKLTEKPSLRFNGVPTLC